MLENQNEKKKRNHLRRYAQFLIILSMLLFRSMSNSRGATEVSKESILRAQTMDTTAKELMEDNVDNVHKNTTIEPKDDLPSVTNTTTNVVVDNDASKDAKEKREEQKSDILVKEIKASTVHNTSNATATSTLAPNQDLPLQGPKEPREYYQQFPPCQIRVTNQKQAHFEVIESTAKLIPYHYLNLTKTCNHFRLNFEFETRERGWLARAKAWAKDLNERLFNTSTVDDSTGITRSFGPAVVGKLRTRSSWDTVIQISCNCDDHDQQWLIETKYAPRICIAHGYCEWGMAMSNFIQVSPHYERYFVPSALPHFDNPPFELDDRLDICTIGSPRRRKWILVARFLENDTKHLDKIRIRILGKGDVPRLLQNYANVTKIETRQIADDRKFYAAVKACGIIMLPIGKDENKGYKHYFKSVNGSNWKLSGTITPIIAFERPFLVPNEILELYRQELPLHVPHRGFEDDDDFAKALSSLLDELLK